MKARCAVKPDLFSKEPLNNSAFTACHPARSRRIHAMCGFCDFASLRTAMTRGVVQRFPNEHHCRRIDSSSDLMDESGLLQSSFAHSLPGLARLHSVKKARKIRLAFFCTCKNKGGQDELFYFRGLRSHWVASYNQRSCVPHQISGLIIKNKRNNIQTSQGL